MQQLGNQLEESLNAGEPVSMAVTLRLFSFPLPLELTPMAASLCASVSMSDLICPTTEAYVELANALGRDRCQLQQRRQTLLDKGAKLPLFDTAGWVKHWEDLLHGLQA